MEPASSGYACPGLGLVGYPSEWSSQTRVIQQIAERPRVLNLPNCGDHPEPSSSIGGRMDRRSFPFNCRVMSASCGFRRSSRLREPHHRYSPYVCIGGARKHGRKARLASQGDVRCRVLLQYDDGERLASSAAFYWGLTDSRSRFSPTFCCK